MARRLAGGDTFGSRVLRARRCNPSTVRYLLRVIQPREGLCIAQPSPTTHAATCVQSTNVTPYKHGANQVLTPPLASVRGQPPERSRGRRGAPVGRPSNPFVKGLPQQCIRVGRS